MNYGLRYVAIYLKTLRDFDLIMFCSKFRYVTIQAAAHCVCSLVAIISKVNHVIDTALGRARVLCHDLR